MSKDKDSPTNPISALNPQEVFFFSGAGISMPAPSNLPSGRDLTQQVIDYACLPGTWDTLINHYFLPANLKDANGLPKTFPRLEAVLESLITVIGPDALWPISICGQAAPNDRHEMIAKHILSGASHVTVNFDPCIELCLPTQAHDRVIHLHGIYGRTSINELGARLSTITTGLPQNLTQKLTDLLINSRGLITAVRHVN